MPQLGFDDVKTNGALPLEPGINEVVILGYEKGQDVEKGKSPYLYLKLATPDGARASNVKLYTSDVVKEGKKNSALDMTLGSVKALANECLSSTEKASLKANNYYDLLTKMLDKMEGKEVRLWLKGEEYVNQNGNISVAYKLPLSGFAESINIPSNETKLKFSKNNINQYSKVIGEEAPFLKNTETIKPEDENGDLPF